MANHNKTPPVVEALDEQGPSIIETLKVNGRIGRNSKARNAKLERREKG
jgi:hypothetical protein